MVSVSIVSSGVGSVDLQNEKKEPINKIVSRTTTTDTYSLGNDQFKQVMYMGAVNIHYLGEYIPVEDYLTPVVSNGKLSFNSPNGDEVIGFDMNYEKTNALSLASPKIEVSKFRGGYYFETNADTEVNSMSYELSSERNIAFEDDKLKIDDFVVDFGQAKREQNITTKLIETIDSKTEEIIYKLDFSIEEGKTGSLERIDPTISYDFANETNMYARHGEDCIATNLNMVYTDLLSPTGFCYDGETVITTNNSLDYDDGNYVLTNMGTGTSNSRGGYMVFIAKYDFGLGSIDDIQEVVITYNGKVGYPNQNDPDFFFYNFTNTTYIRYSYHPLSTSEVYVVFNSSTLNIPIIDIVNETGHIAMTLINLEGGGNNPEFTYTDYVSFEIVYELPSYSSNITYPTTSNPLSTSADSIIPIYWNVTSGGAIVTTGVTYGNITIGGDKAYLQNHSVCEGTLDCSGYATETSCNNCSECSWSEASLEDIVLFEGFESGTQNESMWDVFQWDDGDGEAQIQWDYTNAPHSGSYSCGMDDDDTDTGDLATNVIYTNWDFTGASDIWLSFWEIEYGDEANEAPDTWTGLPDTGYDVVAFTCDGNRWYEIVSEDDLNSETWKYFNLNVSADPDFCVTLNDSFSIMFSQQDNYHLVNDGRAWDDIYMNYTSDAPAGCVNDGSCSSCAIGECDTNCSTGGCSISILDDFGLADDGENWTANVSVPSGCSGSSDLWVDVLYGGNHVNSTETGAITCGSAQTNHTRNISLELAIDSSVNRKSEIKKQNTEEITTSIFLSRLSSLKRLIENKININDLINRLTNSFKKIYQIIKIDIYQEKISKLFRSKEESFSITSILSRLYHALRSSDEYLDITASTYRLTESQRNIIQEFNIDESVFRKLIAERGILELLSMDIDSLRNLLLERGILQALNMGDDIIRRLFSFRGSDVVISVIDSLLKSFRKNINIFQIIYLDDIIDRTSYIFRIISGDISIFSFINNPSGLYQYFVKIIQEININAVASRVASFFRTIYNIIDIEDIVSRLRKVFISILDIIRFIIGADSTYSPYSGTNGTSETGGSSETKKVCILDSDCEEGYKCIKEECVPVKIETKIIEKVKKNKSLIILGIILAILLAISIALTVDYWKKNKKKN